MEEQKKSLSVERTTISLDQEIFRKAKRKAETKGLKFSNYLAGLITKDVSNESFVADDPLSSTLIVDLARALVGELDAKEIAQKLEGKDQPKVLQKWLRGLLEQPTDAGAETAKALRAQFESQPSMAEQMRAKAKGHTTGSA